MIRKYSGLLRRFSALLLFSLLGAQVLAFAPGRGAPASADEWDEVFDTARAVLERMPDADRIATIQDQALREAIRRAYRELKSCAKINKGQPRSVKQAAVAEFERAFKEVEKEAARPAYRECAEKCKSEVGQCEKECAASRKKICGCKMLQFGCIVTGCVFG